MRNTSHHHVRAAGSRLRSTLGVGAVSLIVLAGASLFGVLPAAAASTLSFSTQPPTSVTAGAGMSFAVSVTGGSSGDPITISSTNCTLAQNGNLTEDYSGTNPVNFTDVVIDTGTSCTLTATDTGAGDSGSTTSNSITVTPAAATKLAFSVAPPTTAADNVALATFKVSTEDQYGNVITSGIGSADNIIITSSCTLGGTESATETAGVATFSNVSINTVGNCPLIAEDTSAGDTGFTPATSSAVAVSGGTPTHVAFTVAPPATETTTGTTLTTFKVAVEDAFNNVDTTGTGSTDSITLSSPCTLGGVVTEPAVAGVATFADVNFTTTGTCVITATDATRTLTAATATTIVGEAQPTLSITTTSGYLDTPLTLATTGGAGTGAVTYTVTNGTATHCAVSASGVLTAATGGTCIVTATKAAVSPYASASSVATTVTISSAPLAQHLSGTVTIGRTSVVTISGYNFSGRPTAKSNVAGFSAVVTRDTGKVLTVRITVKASSTRPGVKVMTLTFSNGKRTSFKYSLH